MYQLLKLKLDKQYKCFIYSEEMNAGTIKAKSLVSS